MDIDLDLYRHEVRVSANTLVRLLAIVQLSVPVLAVWGGVAFLAEDVSLRLILAAALILGGIALAIVW